MKLLSNRAYAITAIVEHDLEAARQHCEASRIDYISSSSVDPSMLNAIVKRILDHRKVRCPGFKDMRGLFPFIATNNSSTTKASVVSDIQRILEDRSIRSAVHQVLSDIVPLRHLLPSVYTDIMAALYEPYISENTVLVNIKFMKPRANNAVKDVAKAPGVNSIRDALLNVGSERGINVERLRSELGCLSHVGDT